MKILFALVTGLILMIPQTVFHFRMWGISFNLEGILVLVVFIGFRYGIFSGILGACVLGWLMESFMSVPHGYVMMVHVILILAIQSMISHIYAESYIIKSFWLILLSMGYQYLMAMATGWSDAFLFHWAYFIQAVVQSFVNALLGFPLLIILDFFFSPFVGLGSRKHSQLTGADIFQSKSSQRKYLS